MNIKLVAAAAILGSVSLMACDRNIGLNTTNSTPNDEVSRSEAAIGDSSFLLNLQDAATKDRDQLRVKLKSTRGLSFERLFDLTKGAVLVEKLPAGDYQLIIELISSGVIKERGTSQITVEASKVALADVTLISVQEGVGTVKIQVQKKDETTSSPAQIPLPIINKLVPVFGEKAVSIILKEYQALAECNGFQLEYSRLTSEIIISECEKADPPREIKFSTKLSAPLRTLLEKILANLQYRQENAVKNAMACVPAAGANSRTITIGDANGNKVVLNVGVPACVLESIGSIDPVLFELVSKSAMSLISQIAPLLQNIPELQKK